MPPLKILLSWSLFAGGSCFFSGINEFWGSRLSQKRAAESWETASMPEAVERDGQIIPPGSESRRLIPAGFQSLVCMPFSMSSRARTLLTSAVARDIWRDRRCRDRLVTA